MTDKPVFTQVSQIVEGPQINIAGDHYGPINTYNKPWSIPLQKLPRTRHFVGRQEELASLLDHLQPGYTVTLCGPGGIGKTALVSEALWRLAPGNNPPGRFPDGVIILTFYHQPQATFALEAIARAYGEDPRPSPIDAARRALTGRHALLVLDGAESADDLNAILDVAASCCIIITSRRHRDAPADWSDLSPLPQDQAIQLLHAWGRDYTIDEASSNRICELIGGLPLAIVLAGKYMAQSHQQAANYLAWLETTPLAALDLGERQHQSIPVLMRRSLDRVSDSARASFGIAGVLAMRPFDSELIAIALNVSGQEADRYLGELVDYGILLRPNTYYQVVHKLAYVYARDYLSVERDRLARLAEHYFGLLKTQVGPGLPGKITIDANRDHILAVQSTCLETGEWNAVSNITLMFDTYLDLQGYSNERINVVKAGLKAVHAIGDNPNKGIFFNLLGLAYFDLGDIQLAIEYYNQALAIVHEIGDRQLECYIFSNLGNAYACLGDNLYAIKLYKKALHIARKIGNKYGEGNARGNLGKVYQYLGKLDKAEESYQRSLKIHLEVGDLLGASKALSSLARICIHCGKFEQAIQLHKKRLECARYLRDIRGEYTAICDLGNIYLILGNPQLALGYYNQSLKISNEIKDPISEETILGNLGTIYLMKGEPQRAIDFYKQALLISIKVGDLKGQGADLNNLGIAYYALGEYVQAIEYYKKRLKIAAEMGDLRRKVKVLSNLGAAYESLGESHQAIESYEQSLEIIHKIRIPDAEGNALWNISIILYKIGEQSKAIEYAQSALKVYDQIKSPAVEDVRKKLEEWQG